MTGDRWPDERVVQLRALWTEGHSPAEIGRRLGVSRSSVAKKARGLGLPARPPPPPPINATPRRRRTIRKPGATTLPPLRSLR
ncbi:MAG: GcrA family cell cycle regulator [Acetobacteraceae bacterium]